MAGFRRGHAVEAAAANGPPGDQGKAALHQVEPRCAAGHEVEPDAYAVPMAPVVGQRNGRAQRVAQHAQCAAGIRAAEVFVDVQARQEVDGHVRRSG